MNLSVWYSGLLYYYDGISFESPSLCNLKKKNLKTIIEQKKTILYYTCTP